MFSSQPSVLRSQHLARRHSGMVALGHGVCSVPRLRAGGGGSRRQRSPLGLCPAPEPRAPEHPRAVPRAAERDGRVLGQGCGCVRDRKGGDGAAGAKPRTAPAHPWGLGLCLRGHRCCGVWGHGCCPPAGSAPSLPLLLCPFHHTQPHGSSALHPEPRAPQTGVPCPCVPPPHPSTCARGPAAPGSPRPALLPPPRRAGRTRGGEGREEGSGEMKL